MSLFDTSHLPPFVLDEQQCPPPLPACPDAAAQFTRALQANLEQDKAVKVAQCMLFTFALIARLTAIRLPSSLLLTACLCNLQWQSANCFFARILNYETPVLNSSSISCTVNFRNFLRIRWSNNFWTLSIKARGKCAVIVVVADAGAVAGEVRVDKRSPLR